jgi:hypothetical protein
MSLTSMRNLAGGELDPALHAGTDLVKYATGAKTMRNTFIRRSGGGLNRPGTEYVARVSAADNGLGAATGHVLIPYILNDSTGETTYLIEAGYNYLRPLLNGAQILETALVITGITAANPPVVTYTGADPAGFANGQEVYISGVVGMTELNGKNFKVANVNTGANTFELQKMDYTNLDASAYTAYVSGGTFQRVYTIANGSASPSRENIQWDQQGEDLYLLIGVSRATLTRVTDTNWTFSGWAAAPTIGTPATLTTTIAGAAGWAIAVSAVDRDSGEEGLARGILCDTSGGGTITAAAVTNAKLYRYYLSKDAGVWGLFKESANRIFRTAAIENETVDLSRKPPGSIPAIPGVWTGENPWVISRPRVLKFAQQRLWLAAPASPTTDIGKVWASHVSGFKNFSRQYPLADDGTIAFQLAGVPGDVRHILNLERLVILTSKGEHVCHGNDAGYVTPTSINAKQFGYNGSSRIPPVVIDGSAIYLQEGNSIVRDLFQMAQTQGYQGTDLTPFSAHLFDGHTIVDWAYQKLPTPILWCVRDDGVMIALTYVKDQNIWGWHRHDTDGLYKSVACIREGLDYVLYMTVQRTINGETVTYVERVSTRQIDDQKEMNFMDCASFYDGRNAGATTMTVSGGSGDWSEQDLTLTASAAAFTAADVGSEIQVTDAAGTVHALVITAYTSTTVVTVQCADAIPADLQALPTTDWALAKSVITGLFHLEGESLSVLGDALVVASPNNSKITNVVTVTNGQASLGACYGVVRLGLPYISDIETLNIDKTEGGKRALTNKTILYLLESRGIFVGTKAPTATQDPIFGLTELKLREFSSSYDPTVLKTGEAEVPTSGNWSTNGRVFIRQVDPLPMGIMAIHAEGLKVGG